MSADCYAVVELTEVEAEALGRWQLRLSRALHQVLDCQKTYVAQFSEAEGHHHLHFHVVPRMADQPDDRRGPAIFGYRTDPANVVSEVDHDTLAIRLRAAGWLTVTDSAGDRRGLVPGRNSDSRPRTQVAGVL